jgi:hypothetical protein
VPVIEAPDDVEVVRVVSSPTEAAPAEDLAEVEEAPPPEVEPEPEVVAEDAEEEAEEAEVDEAAEAAEVDDEALDDEAVEAEASPTGVDDLFARIRESRAENVARAREVLDQPLEANGAVAVAVVEVAQDEAVVPEAADPDSERLAARDAAVTDIEALVVRKLKRLLADEQNEVQDLVRRQQGKVDQIDVLGERDHHVGRFVAAVGGELLAAVSAGASFYDPAGHPADVDLSAIDERLAHELIDPLRQLVGRGVDEARGDEDELLDRVRSAYREVKSQRVEPAARVVTLSAFNLGVVTSQPEGAWLRWAVDPVAGCSPDCDDNALAGPVVAGEAYPTGAAYPPNHPGCRCLLVPADQ